MRLIKAGLLKQQECLGHRSYKLYRSSWGSYCTKALCSRKLYLEQIWDLGTWSCKFLLVLGKFRDNVRWVIPVLCKNKWDQISTPGFIQLYSRFTKKTWINHNWSCGYNGWISKATEVFVTWHISNWTINFPPSQLPIFKITCLIVLQFSSYFLYVL